MKECKGPATAAKTRIPLAEPCLEGRVCEYLAECIATNYVSSIGPFVERFEREFAAFVGSRFAVACSSGTAALHVAMRLLGVREGVEVFVPTLTFIASANPILYQGGTPVFVDAEPETWNLDPDLVVEELDRRGRSGRPQPRIVEVVHLLGQPAQIEPILEACERHGVSLLEDASEALGASYVSGKSGGRQVGTIGRLGCFSFNGNKVMTTGGGGMIVTDDESLARRAKHLVQQARLPGPEYLHDEVGYNYGLSNLGAALGLAQLEQLPTFLAKKRRIALRYDRAFRGRKGLLPPPRPSWSDPSFWLYSVRVRPDEFGCDRTGLMRLLEASAIQARPIWKPLHTQVVYRGARLLGGSVAAQLFREGLSLPSSVGLSEEEQERVIAAVLG